MKIVVCVKQVPNIAAIKFDPATKTILRTGVPLEVSAFDIRALLKAVDIVKEHGGEVVAITMGPPQAAQALQHCLALGADRAVHLSDKAFAGSDTLATARTLALAIRREPFDLIFCGRYSVDAETAQVGPELAEMLDIAQVTAARTIAFNADRTLATVERETDDGVETLEVRLPLLLTATEDLAPERFPMKKDREAAKTKPLATLTAADLGADPATLGQAGSPTSVREIQTLDAKRQCSFVDGDTVQAKVNRLVSILRDRGLLGHATKGTAAMPTLLPAGRSLRSPQPIAVVAELLGGRVRYVTYELLGAAHSLARKLERPVAAVLIGRDLKSHISTLAAHGADRVFVAEAPDLAPYRTEPHAAVLTRFIADHRPHSVLFASSAIGRDLAPRVAARLGLGLTSDCIGLEVDGDGNLVQLKPAFGGSIVAPILSRTFPQMATARPGILQAARPDPSRRAQPEAIPFDGVPSRTRVLSISSDNGGAAAELDTAHVVVGFGMGIGGPENLPVIRDFAAALKAPLATTRDCCDKGWLPRHHQVGLTGRAIAPQLYFAIGIRGAFEHTVGIRKAGIVVAINNDDQAWIWDSADLGMKGDWKEIVPALTKALATEK